MIIFAAIAFFILMFFIFVFVFRRIMNRNVNTAVQHLDEINQDYMKKQDEITKKLQEAEDTAQKTLSQAKDEALKMRQDLIKQTKDETEAAVKKARQEANDIIEQAEKTRHALISELERKIATESIKKATLLVAQTLPEESRSQIHSRLVEEMLTAGLKEVDRLGISANLKEAKLMTAAALTPKAKDAFADGLKAKISQDLSLIEEIDEGLIAGCMVVLGSLVLDGSLRFKIADKAKKLIEKENE
ncbi:F0F1 ATP synthase subunit delta [Candidatus Omnitrophota bacterium]